MKPHKWAIDTRNKLSEIAFEFNSAAAIEGACMTPEEREKCRKHLNYVVKFMDKEILKAWKKEKKIRK